MGFGLRPEEGDPVSSMEVSVSVRWDGHEQQLLAMQVQTDDAIKSEVGVASEARAAMVAAATTTAPSTPSG